MTKNKIIHMLKENVLGGVVGTIATFLLMPVIGIETDNRYLFVWFLIGYMAGAFVLSKMNINIRKFKFMPFVVRNKKGFWKGVVFPYVALLALSFIEKTGVDVGAFAILIFSPVKLIGTMTGELPCRDLICIPFFAIIISTVLYGLLGAFIQSKVKK